MTEWYNRKGEPISIEEANPLMVDPEYKVVEQTYIGVYMVSTVWLGLDHNWMRQGPPVIFETMVFAVDTWDPIDGRLSPELDIRRYATEEQAREGHEEMCLLVRATSQTELGDLVESLEEMVEEDGDVEPGV